MQGRKAPPLELSRRPGSKTAFVLQKWPSRAGCKCHYNKICQSTGSKHDQGLVCCLWGGEGAGGAPLDTDGGVVEMLWFACPWSFCKNGATWSPLSASYELGNNSLFHKSSSCLRGECRAVQRATVA